MQKKVSKQSLAVLLLSILLAISMGLTATFAAFSATNTAKGYITFAGGLTITFTGITTANGVSAALVGGAGDDKDQLKISFTETAFEANSDGNFQLTAAALAEVAKIKVTITSGVEKKVYYKSQCEAEESDAFTISATDLDSNYTAASGAMSKDITFDAIFDEVTDVLVEDTISSETLAFSIVFDAQYQAFA